MVRAAHLTVLCGLVLASVCAPALAAPCRQQFASYAERDAGAVLQFLPATGSAVASHAFTVTFKENGIVLKGFAMQDAASGRPHGQLMLNCPEGDVTGDEIAACTVWEGVIYAVDPAGTVALLPPGEADAADQLILPGLASWLRASTAYGDRGLSKMPWDVFRLAGCAKP